MPDIMLPELGFGLACGRSITSIFSSSAPTWTGLRSYPKISWIRAQATPQSGAGARGLPDRHAWRLPLDRHGGSVKL